MENHLSLSKLKTLTEKKIKKKILIKFIWDDNEKITLLITPNMKINSFIHEEEGYVFYDEEGKRITYEIPFIVPEEETIDGKVKLRKTNSGRFKIYNKPLTDEDILFLKETE